MKHGSLKLQLQQAQSSAQGEGPTLCLSGTPTATPTTPGSSGGQNEKKLAAGVLALVVGVVLVAGYVGQFTAARQLVAAKEEARVVAAQEQLRREATLQEKLEAAKGEISKVADAAKATAAEATTTASNALTVANEAMGKADAARGGIAGLQRDVAKLRDEVATKASEEDVTRRFAELSAKVEGKVSRTELVDHVDEVVKAKMAATTAAIQQRMAAHQTHLNGLYKAQEERIIELSKRTAPKYR